MTSSEKRIIIDNLKRIKSSPSTIWSLGIAAFLKDPNNQDRDYIDLINQIQEQITSGSKIMKDILGDTYNFFKGYK